MANKALYWGVGIVAFLLVFTIASYNGLVTKELAVDEAYANMDVQYQRRYDLIPNLVNTVKGYAEHERELFERVTAQRSAWANAESVAGKQAAAGALESSISRLLLVAENYPELKANENFLTLQSQLEGTENRISVARTRYNEVVKEYNTRTRVFPSNIIANMFGFEAQDSYEAETAAADAPQVEF